MTLRLKFTSGHSSHLQQRREPEALSEWNSLGVQKWISTATLNGDRIFAGAPIRN